LRTTDPDRNAAHNGTAQAGRRCGLEPEARVLLLSAGGPESDHDLDAAVAAAMRGTPARARLDWDGLLQLAVHERAEAVLWRRLADLDTAPDAGFMDTLRRLALIASFRQQYLEARFAEALDLLEREGLRPLLLKGAALGTAAYDSFAERPMGDVDLLLPDGQAEVAHALLRDAGWHSDGSREAARFYDVHHHLVPLYDTRYADATLEVHRYLLPAGSPFQLEGEQVWMRARRIPWRGRQVLVPAMQDVLLHLCIHYAWAHMAHLGTWRTFRDLHVVARQEVDWPAFTSAARAARAATCCYWTLRLAARCGGVPIPAAVLEELRPRQGAAGLDLIERHLAANLLPGRHACPSVGMLRWMWEAAIRPTESGHGTIRPWHEAPRRPAPVRGGWVRLRSQAHRIRAWGRYLTAVVRG
jgi:hypothetical protein